MIYNDFQNIKLSALGFGTMRLPTGPGGDKDILEDEAARMFDCAYENGVNYYDTAWGYHFGLSEVVTGKMLSRYPRDSFYLADKFPGYDVSNMDKVESIFEEQLKRCKVEYFDFYLFHNVFEGNVDYYLDEKYGILEYLLRQKENGRIRHLGFSGHGAMPVLEKFLNAYGKHMEFGQLQLNYLDWDFQKAKEKLELLKKWNLPAWVMEPLRGGKLSNLPPEVSKRLRKMRDVTDTEWALRFLQSLPEVTVTLSGMSSYEQTRENVETYRERKPLSDEEMAALLKEAEGMVSEGALPCTACRYCVSHCPMGLDIPDLIGLYNEHKVTGGGFIAPMAVAALPQEKKPSACIACRSCEAVCPQGLPIADTMAEFSKMLRLK